MKKHAERYGIVLIAVILFISLAVGAPPTLAREEALPAANDSSAYNPNLDDNFTPEGPLPAPVDELPGMTLIFDDDVPLADIPPTGAATPGYGAALFAAAIGSACLWRRRARR